MHTARHALPATTSLALRVRALRRAAKLAQADLAAAVGVSRSHVAKIETGQDLPGRALLAAIATQFDVSLDWLSCGEGDPRAACAMTEAEAAWLHAYRCLPKPEAAHLLNYVLTRAQAPDAVH